jgi:hypothetical protein
MQKPCHAKEEKPIRSEIDKTELMEDEEKIFN